MESIGPTGLSQRQAAKKLAFGYATLNRLLDDRLLTAGQCAANCDPPADQKACSNTNMYAEVQRFREVMADVWSDVQLIHAVSCQPRGGVFENKIAILTGSNSEFLTETRPLSMWLDVEQLYLSRKHDEKALRLLPLVKVVPSPRSAMNACYFFNRLENNGIRFVSYIILTSRR